MAWEWRPSGDESATRSTRWASTTAILRAVSGPGALALVGGDELKPGNEAVDEILVRAAVGGPAFVLATAAARHRPDLAVRHATDWFGSLGLEVRELPVLGRRQANAPQTAALAATGRFFYLVGGDPGLVVRVLRGTRTWDAVHTAWRGGAALAGSSAGAMAMGEWSLVREGWPNATRRRYLDALGVLAGVSVIPHFETFGHDWVPSALAAAPRPDATLLGIDERTGALWQDGWWRAVGPGRVTVIRSDGEAVFDTGRTVDGLPDPVG